MPDPDPNFRDDVRRRAEEGLTTRMVSASRNRFTALHGLTVLALSISCCEDFDRAGPTSMRTVISSALLLVVLGLTIWRYRGFSPSAGKVLSESEHTAALDRSYRCARCGTVVLPEENECPRCGSVRDPWSTLGVGILLGLAMTTWALWRAGLFTR
jgi:hypothetical protein